MTMIHEKALFLGPRSENKKFFKAILNWMIDDHMDWRRDFHPDDKPVLTRSDEKKEDFKATLQKTKEALVELAANLQKSSVPWFSPRYLGHMTADTLMAANLGYILTLLYNPNNCAYEASPITTSLEIEVGRQLACMLGYDPARSWGHIASGGTVANYEGFWVARNVKSIPHAIKQVQPELVKNLTDWQLLNMPIHRTLDLLDKIKVSGKMEEVLRHSVRGTGVRGHLLGKVLVPQSKHYSWVKAADILGTGQDNLITIQVKDDYRMDIRHLKQTIDGLIEQKIPILAVVAVVGSTEEGAVDEVHEIVRLRKEYERQGISFYLHIDAAYGGYARTVFLDEENAFMDFDTLKRTLRERSIISPEIDWPKREVYDAYRAMPEADSITIDPHKMGYVPYASGAIVFKDKRVLDLTSYFAAYVFEKTEDNPILLGSYIMEGSKAGATVAATWMAHRVVPLNITGYGRIIGCSIEGANRFYGALRAAIPIEIKDRNFIVLPLTEPDFNMVDFAFNEDGNNNLKTMNQLNQKIYEQCSYKSGPVYNSEFITSKTELSYEEYGDAPKSFVLRFDIPEEEWDRVRSVYVLRSCVLTPYLKSNTTFDEYWQNFMNTMWKNLRKII
ncbi:MAG: pyridoxal-dependent decarboxylase [bacterium]